ncbi:RagB/SusD family nutrient uptake outer membrane protein [Bacteroidota bacterium]
MRRRTIFVLMFIIMLSHFSCNEYMELIPPEGLIREEFWKNQSDVESVLMAAYQRFAALDEMLFVFGEVRADMVVGDVNQNNRERLLAESNIYSDNNISNWWDYYRVINNCNEVIKNAVIVQEIDKTFSDFERLGLESEAYFLRSLMYFYLVRLYKEVPLVLEPTESDDADFYKVKSSEETILDQIVSDLEANRQFAPNGGFTSIQDNKGRASKAAFDALLADIALWRFDYEAVVRHVEKIELTKQYVLMPSFRWFELYYPGNSLESIMEFQFDNSLGQNNGTYGLTNNNAKQYKPSQKALELLSSDFTSEIIRGEDASIAKIGEDEFIIWKYVGRAPDGNSTRSGSDQQSCNWIVYRYADVLLMKAEALSQIERYDEARVTIQMVRSRAGVPPLVITDSPAAFEDAILTERARELCFEGKRWFDLLRMGRRNNYARKSKLIEIIVSNVPSTQKRILAVKLSDPLGWYLPIFDEETERNKFLVQNPFYDN